MKDPENKGDENNEGVENVGKKETKEEVIKENIINPNPVGYFVDLIYTISTNIKKGKGLSKKGVYALLLFILTASLVYPLTGFPSLTNLNYTTLTPLFFLSYFIYDVLKNFESVKRFVRKINQKKDLAYEDIMSNGIPIEEVKSALYNISFSAQQYKDIIKHLMDIKEFDAAAQRNIFANTYIFSGDLLLFIKEYVIKNQWHPSAVCMLLYQKENCLNEEFLQQILEKYRNFKSVIFCLGKYQYLTFNEKNFNEDEKNYYLAGFNSRKIKKGEDAISLLIAFVIMVVFFVLVILLEKLKNQYYSDISWFILGLASSILLLGMLGSMRHIKRYYRQHAVKSALRKQKIEMPDSKLEKFFGEINYSENANL
ncbi:MAG: hypothetical protein CVT89_02545 [Candidatus Altiarchaeales archaeon HGW-Altiarchaeales-2]|nr:MAG: hypothetical protein CVT89_02545 [Candidatus Altiarchaeales archaeon HGW-Altiarchaeales-2]